MFSNFTPAVAAAAGHHLQLEAPSQVNAMIETFTDQKLR
jgi:hypothetical protein